MKTTFEIPDSVFKKAKAKAAEQGVSLGKFVTEAIEAKLNFMDSENKPWLKLAGGLRHLHKENVRIDRIIEEEFGKIDQKGWK